MAKQVQATTRGHRRASRPRDAATMVLVRFEGGQPCVLMGRRRIRDQWSDLWIFPGGRVDRADGYTPYASDLRTAVRRRLECGCSSHRARALGIAAVRETWEETGLRLAVPGEVPSRVRREWQGFLDQGQLPALGHLHYLARAITPPYRPKRFDARFFVADAKHTDGALSGTGELGETSWVSFGDAEALETPNITRAILAEIRAMLDRHGELRTEHQVPFFRALHGQHHRLLE